MTIPARLATGSFQHYDYFMALKKHSVPGITRRRCFLATSNLLWLVAGVFLSACTSNVQIYEGKSFEIGYSGFQVIKPPESSIDALFHQFCDKKACLYIYEGNTPKRYNADVAFQATDFYGIRMDRYSGDEITEFYAFTGKKWPRLLHVFYRTIDERVIQKHVKYLKMHDTDP